MNATTASPSDPAAFERAKASFLSGLAAFEAGRPDEAEAHYLASLALLPGRVSTLINLAAAQLALARPQQALATAAQVLAIEPGNADAHFHQGNALGTLGRAPEALAAYERALAANPGLVPAWTHRGNLLRELQRPREAAESFARALALGADPQLHAYYLASVGAADAAPATAPGHYVETLFDDYAEGFDAHLVGTLGYSAHRTLTEPLAALGRAPFASALDLGCGTGLCGPLVKPLTKRLEGVDLSSRMLEKAAALGVYDQLMHRDIVAHLQETPERHDLVLAADVFIYIGALEPVFAGVRRVIASGGVFCLSAELAPDNGADYRLLPSLRYAQSGRYLRALAAAHGFEVLRWHEAPIREEQRVAVPGVFVYLSA